MLTEHQLKNLDFQYSLFTQTLFKETGVEFVDFNHPYIEKNEKRDTLLVEKSLTNCPLLRHNQTNL